jgi:uncharacterized protein involved in type VI secretion and phage assembly
VSDFSGVACGIVKEIDDKLGRVRVNLPWLPGENKTYWARLAVAMAGNGRGAWFLPEIEDEVLLAFEMGKIDHPYVVGFLWSEADKPPVSDTSIDGKVRRFRSVKKHHIDFDDRDNSEKLLVESSSKHGVELEDSKKFVEVRTKGKRSIRLDDDKSAITIRTAAAPIIEMKEQTPQISIRAGSSDPSVVLDGTPGSVTITVGQNTVTVDQSGITIKATGNLTVKGSMVTIASDGPLTLQGSVVSLTASSIFSATTAMASFTGVVQATSIVSPSYTPGAGNLL